MTFSDKTATSLAAIVLLSTLQLPSQAMGDSLVLEEVIVTASRRTERLQDVAMSVSAFSSDFFRDSGVNNLAGIEQYTPSLKITPGTDSRSTSIRIRGIGSVGTNVGIDPSVGLFIDGVYQGRAGMSIADLVDVERVEVLRGPQGTLYGKNTAAGAISVITKTPSENFETTLEVQYDSNERGELRGMVNLPFGNSGHAARISAYGVDGDHLFENTWTGDDVNDASKWGGRARVLFDLSGSGSDEGLGQLILGADYTEEDTDCCALAVMDYNGLSTLNAPLTHDPSAALQQELGLNAQGQYILQYNAFEDTEGFSPPAADPFSDDYWYDGELYNKVEVGGLSAEWSRDFIDNSIVFLNAWRFYESDSAYDGDFTAYDAVQGSQDVDLDQFSSELRITSPGGETLDYQAGLYAYYSELDSVGTFEMSESLVDNINLGFFFPDGSINTDTNDYTTTSYAAFGQVVWSITDAFSATIGARYTWEKKEREGSQITEPEVFFEAPPVAGPNITYDESRTDDDISPSVNLRYFFHPDIMGYVSVSRGFKSGGYNQRRELSGLNGEFDEETSTTYELGWKTSWGNRRLQFNGALFFVDYEDFQAQAFDGSSLRVTNAGDMESYGSELELLYIPAAGTTLGTAIGYNKAEYDSFDNGQCTVEQTFYQYYVTDGAQGGAPGTNSFCVQDLAGEALDNAPEWTVSSFLQYERLFGERFAAVFRLEHNYTDSYYLDQDLDENLKNDAVDIVNLRLSLSNLDRTWEVAIWGRNLLDEEYYNFGIDIPTVGGYAGVVAPDAHYGITLRYSR